MRLTQGVGVMAPAQHVLLANMRTFAAIECSNGRMSLPGDIPSESNTSPTRNKWWEPHL